MISHANQCPYEGGISVYRARVLVSLLNDSIGYEDESVCELQGIYRQSINNSINEIDNGIIIRPNPTSDYAEIILHDHSEGLCNIEIKDMTGRSVYTGSFNCKEKSKKVSVSNLNVGIYTVTVVINNNFVKSTKLSIIR